MPSTLFSPNPFALAQLLLPQGQLRDYNSWDEAQALLAEAFRVKADMIFDGDKATPPVFQLFRDCMDEYKGAQALATLLQQPAAQKAIKVFGQAAMQKVLPFLVPVTDSAFAKPGAAPSGPNEIAGFDTLGAFVDGGASYLDPRQGMVADCYLISSMISAAWSQPARWQKYLDKVCLHGPAGESYRFDFILDDDSLCPAFDVPPWVPVSASDQPCFARSSEVREAWPALVEKAFVLQRCARAPDDPMPADYQHIGVHRLFPAEACHMLIGGTGDFETSMPDRPLVPFLRDRCPVGSPRLVTVQPTMATTHTEFDVDSMKAKGLTWDSTGLVFGHAYAVLGLMKQGDTEYVVLRNPHGVSKTGVSGYAKEAWVPGAGANGEPTVQLDQNGVFGLPVDWFEACFGRVDWVDVQG